MQLSALISLRSTNVFSSSVSQGCLSIVRMHLATLVQTTCFSSPLKRRRAAQLCSAPPILAAWLGTVRRLFNLTHVTARHPLRGRALELVCLSSPSHIVHAPDPPLFTIVINGIMTGKRLSLCEQSLVKACPVGTTTQKEVSLCVPFAYFISLYPHPIHTLTTHAARDRRRTISALERLSTL